MELEGADVRERLAFFDWYAGRAPVDAETYLSILVDLLQLEEPTTRLEVVLGDGSSQLAYLQHLDLDRYAAQNGVASSLRDELAAAFEEAVTSSDTWAVFLTSAHAGALIEQGRFSEAVEAVDARVARLSDELSAPPACVDVESGDVGLQEAREARQQLRAVRAHALSGLGAADEQLAELKAAHEALEEMRASFVLGRTNTFNRSIHAYVAVRYAAALMTLSRFGAASDVLEAVAGEDALFESFDPEENVAGVGARHDMRAEVLLNLAIARIGDEIGAGGRADDDQEREPFESAESALDLVAELDALEGVEYPVVDVDGFRAGLWRAWIGLERGADGVDELLERCRSRLDALEPGSVDPTESRHLDVLEARRMRAIESAEDVAPSERRRSMLEAARDGFVAQWMSIPPRREGLGVLTALQSWELVSELAHLELESGDALEAVERTIGHLEKMLACGSQPRLLRAHEDAWRTALDRFLSEGRGVLVAVPTGFGPARVLLLEAERVSQGWTAPMEPLEDAVGDFVARLGEVPAESGGTRSSWEGPAAALSAALLDSAVLERLVELDRVVVVGFDLFGSFPFAALPHPTEGTLGTHLALTEVPSLTVAGALLTRSSGASRGSVLLVTNASDAGPGRPVRVEPALRRRWAGSEGSVDLVGSDATVDRLAAELAKPSAFGAVVFVTHGGRAPTAVRSAGLRLTPDPENGHSGLLLADEAESLELAGTQVVVLASCGAGKERIRLGDAGSTGLPGAFARAGAAGVLYARGDLPVDATVELIDEFLDHWERGEPADVALRAARRAVASNDAWSDPFFHAQLQLVGGR